MDQHEKFFEYIRDNVAVKSLCLRDKCGAVIIINDNIVAEGYNAPPNDDLRNRKCELDFPTINRKKPKASCQCCDHAEVRAITSALKNNIDLTGSTMYFTRIDKDGNIAFSGEPYCVECSRFALHSGIANWALWHEDGIKLYEACEYNDLSFNFHLDSRDQL